jgi:hypothetical protein
MNNQYARFTDEDQTTGIFVRPDGTETVGPLPPIAGDLSMEFQAFLEAGGVIEGYVPAPPFVPTSASKLGLKRAFAELGMWEQVKAALAANEDAQEEWDLAIEIKRTDAIVQAFIVIFELTAEQVDQLLIRAALLTQ